MYIQDLIDIIGAMPTHAYEKHYHIEEFYIDTRQISQVENTVFCALISEKRDGHQFITDAYEKGVRYFIVSQKQNEEIFPEAHFLYVNNTIQALQMLAQHQREQYNGPVIGIAGSNGKTIVKEWLSSILSQIPSYQKGFGLIKSPKSYNSQIGVPLSVWRIQPQHTLAIFEAGISKINEMQYLERIIQPTIGVFTNVGDAHSEFFESIEEKVDEKLKLFTHAQILITNGDNALLNHRIQHLQNQHPALKICTYSEQDKDAFVYIQSRYLSRNSCTIQFTHQQQEYAIKVPFTQQAYIENAMLVTTILLYLNVDIETIQKGLHQLRAVAMRLEVRNAVNDSILISDTYNSDITSLNVALDFLSQQLGQNKTIILSDIKESGYTPQENIDQIIKSLKKHKIQKFIGIGSDLINARELIQSALNIPMEFYISTDQYLKEFSSYKISKETILLKGARSFEFERIQHRLELSIHQTVMEVDLNALEHNFQQYKSLLSPQTKMMAMVKAYSYGHGGLEIAQKLHHAGVNYLAVAYADEGIELRNGGINLPIMVMSPEISGFESMIRWKLEPEIFNLYSLKLFCEMANKYQEVNYPIHIKLDTGMHRLGFNEEQLEELMQFLKSTHTLKIASIFTHLAGSDDEELNPYTELQSQRYRQMSDYILSQIDYKPIRHIANTAGIVNFKELEYDMVRLGIGLYGINNTPQSHIHLKPVATLKTYIVQIRTLEADETIGYNRKGRLHRKSQIATVAIGYADGYSRCYAQAGGYMIIHGQKAPIIGNICMDMCMVDVTDIDNVQEGDEVIVFGSPLPITTLADWSHTIPYEVLTGISKRVKRIHIND